MSIAFGITFVYLLSDHPLCRHSSGFCYICSPGICAVSGSLGTAVDFLAFVLPEYALFLAV